MASLYDNFLDPEHEERWEEVRETLEEFQSCLSSKVPKLRIERSDDVIGWKEQAGVYLLFSKDEELIYVGRTLRAFQERHRRHKRIFEVEYTDLIVFPKKFDFLALALERLLIVTYRPRFNQL
jgi:GIY-YIG catalytic domain